MIGFFIIAAALVAVALAWVLFPLLRRRTAAGVAQSVSNLSIYRDQLAELEADVKSGVLTPEHYEQAKAELERRVLEDVGPEAPAAAPIGRRSKWIAATLAIAIPLCAALLYWQLGSPEAIGPNVRGDSHALSPQEMESMAQRLAARLEKNPDDVDGWVMLARTYYVMQRFADAVAVYEKLAAMVPDNADLLADYADVLGMSQGRNLEGKPMALVKRALAINPAQWKALAMAGTYAFDRKDYPEAVRYWEQLRTSVPPESPMAQSIAASIAEARKLGGIKTLPTPTAKASAEKPAPAAAGGSVEGTVTLSSNLAAKASPGDAVFVFARAAQGPKMPLAIFKGQAKDLPLRFKLDDSMAMAPNMKLSSFPEIVVGARISKAGGAMAQSGDLQGFSKPVRAGSTNVTVVIDHTVP